MTTVFGSINVDLVSRVATLPGPGETVSGSDYVLFPGGKGANQALAARRAGAAVRMIGAVGDDAMAATALAELRAGGVDLAAVRALEGATGLALITVDAQGENSIVVTAGANARAEAAWYDGPQAAPDMLLAQMEVPFGQTAAAARKAHEAGGRVMLSIAPFTPLSVDDLGPFAFIVVNEHEARDLAAAYGLATGDPRAIPDLLAGHLDRQIVVTLGAAGAVTAGPEGAVSVPAPTVQVVDTTGAGDTFAGALAAFLDEGRPLDAAMRLAAVAGALTCTREGAQPSFPQRDDILAMAT